MGWSRNEKGLRGANAPMYPTLDLPPRRHTVLALLCVQTSTCCTRSTLRRQIGIQSEGNVVGLLSSLQKNCSCIFSPSQGGDESSKRCLESGKFEPLVPDGSEVGLGESMIWKLEQCRGGRDIVVIQRARLGQLPGELVDPVLKKPPWMWMRQPPSSSCSSAHLPF